MVFHTAVLAYVTDAEDRAEFARTVRELGAVWIANEHPACIPGVPERYLTLRADDHYFLLCRDGVPTAWTDSHGTAIDWGP